MMIFNLMTLKTWLAPNNNSQHLLSPLFVPDTDLNILRILSHLVLMTTI